MKNLIQLFGGWPVIDRDWSESNVPSMESLFGRIKRKLNDGIILELWIGPDDKNSSIHVIQVNYKKIKKQSFSCIETL